MITTNPFEKTPKAAALALVSLCVLVGRDKFVEFRDDKVDKLRCDKRVELRGDKLVEMSGDEVIGLRRGKLPGFWRDKLPLVLKVRGDGSVLLGSGLKKTGRRCVSDCSGLEHEVPEKFGALRKFVKLKPVP